MNQKKEPRSSKSKNKDSRSSKSKNKDSSSSKSKNKDSRSSNAADPADSTLSATNEEQDEELPGMVAAYVVLALLIGANILAHTMFDEATKKSWSLTQNSMETDPLTLIKSMFIHGGWGHLGGNMIALAVLTPHLIAATGVGTFLLVYLCGGILGGVATFAPEAMSAVHSIGASDGVYAVVAATVLVAPLGAASLHRPDRNDLTILLFCVLTLFALPQFDQLTETTLTTGTNHLAHFGGAIAGVLVVMLRGRFDPRIVGLLAALVYAAMRAQSLTATLGQNFRESGWSGLAQRPDLVMDPIFIVVAMSALTGWLAFCARQNFETSQVSDAETSDSTDS